MATSKFTVSVSLTIDHPDDRRLTKKVVRERVRDMLETDGGPQPDDLEIMRAVVRDVDID